MYKKSDKVMLIIGILLLVVAVVVLAAILLLPAFLLPCVLSGSILCTVADPLIIGSIFLFCLLIGTGLILLAQKSE